ncbi:MAG: hypothetical protein OEZ01_08435 [Candidatus Heimdallarchaeota archaeon]|nr:hypothetical protein [Candidatus Heimdallarchaeota archaeon]MDH5646021.1 hypothetical protein [Candidatus Heimdallarchaeota archaeon]
MTDLSNLNITELYEWVNSQYEKFSNGEISEEQYNEYLEYYKERLAKSETQTQNVSDNQVKVKKVEPSKVKSTSIAGLRKKLMEEMKK